MLDQTKVPMMKTNLMLVLILSLGSFPLTAQEPEPDAGYAGKGTGEQFCWNFNYNANDLLDAYEATKDLKSLEAAEAKYDAVVAKLLKDPDGYPGTIGPDIGVVSDGSTLWADTVIGDALVARPLLRFAEIVNSDSKLKERWGAKAQSYIDLATKMCWEKWNHRGCYYEDAEGYGSYHTHPFGIDRKNPGKWVPRPEHLISENLNKHYQMGIVMVRLWRLTGKDEYKKRVIAIFSRAKAMWRHYPEEDRVVWNFWMPHGPYDMEGTAPKSWVGVHPERPGYQAGEVDDWVEIYDSGLVFEQADLERIIRTNLWMAGGDPSAAGPIKWKNADGTTGAGTLWGALARFDAKIWAALEADLSKKKNATALAYLNNVTEKQLGWKRIYVKDESKVEVAKPPLQPGKFLVMAMAVPNTVEIANGDRIRLGAQTRAAGKLVVDLCSEDGSQVLGNIATLDAAADSEYHAPLWDGTNLKTGVKEPGKYLIRWTLNNETRTWPVVVKQGQLREKKTATALKPGESLKVDFESPVDPLRVVLQSAVVSEEQAHGGKTSLKVEKGQQPQIHFGEMDNLPVRISMWVYDGGEKYGKASTNGAGWGVRTAAGDKFVIRKVWRGYLNGDNRYAWFNTGENQYFNPHPLPVDRVQGWSEWVFDFSNPQKPVISCNGKELTGLKPEKFVPSTGAVSVFFIGGDGGSAPVYVDDITVDYGAR